MKNKVFDALKFKEQLEKKPRILFSKFFISIILLVVQLGLLITLDVVFYKQAFAFYTLFEILGLLVIIVLVNDKNDNSYKITWLVLIAICPLVGAVFYLLFAHRKFTKREMKKYEPLVKEIERGMNSHLSNNAKAFLSPEKDADALNMATYIRKASYVDIFKNTKVDYYPWGEDALEPMLEALRKAEHYIFIEYFIITPGRFWDSILAILVKKASQGVDVRLIYDDLGCASTLTGNYYKLLRSKGIKAYKFSPIIPILDVRMNNRDHRKIMVIDGYIGFTGGINLADEYINDIVRFGKWKDNSIRLIGDGVFGLTILFLTVWTGVVAAKNKKQPQERISYVDYLPSKYHPEVCKEDNSLGFVQPYGSIPFTFETIGANVYELLLMRAKKYVYITTPYLILNQDLQNAICQAAKNGVDVKILTPHIPDKKLVFQLTRSFYKPLIEAGVKIYEFTPGFVHAKTFVVDGVMATVGTINLDYRSLFLHFENGTFMYKVPAIKDIEKDMIETFKVSMEYTLEMCNATKWYVRFGRALLKIFAPLM